MEGERKRERERETYRESGRIRSRGSARGRNGDGQREVGQRKSLVTFQIGAKKKPIRLAIFFNKNYFSSFRLLIFFCDIN